MARFKVEISHTVSRTYEVEAESRSDIHDQFEDSDEEPAGWVLVEEDYGTEEVTFIRDLDD